MEWKMANNHSDWQEVRTRVFIQEQGFHNEFDDIDAYATHITCYLKGSVIGCARCFRVDEETWRIGRIAVLEAYRHVGIGEQLLQKAEDIAKSNNAKRAILDAQCQAQQFYEKSKYQAKGEIHMDEHVPHILMIKKL